MIPAESLEPGAELCVRHRGGGLQSVRVVRTTRTHVITDGPLKQEVRWRRKDGRRVGVDFHGSPELVVWTDDLRARARHQSAVSDLKSAIYAFEKVDRSRHRRLPVAELEAASIHLRRAVEEVS